MKKNGAVLGILIVAFAVVLTSVAYATHIPVQCNDGSDNDLDGTIDFPSDTGCSSATDRTESIILGYAKGCLTDGDKLKDVFGNVNYQCSSTQCDACVLMTEAGNWSTITTSCDGLPLCGFNNGGGGGGGSGPDLDPPSLTINSPTNGTVYNSRAVLINLNVDERSDIHYLDLINGRGRWTPVCTDCFSYDRTRSFREGINNLQFRAVDSSRNAAYKNVSFFIDSTKPRILKTEPGRGFTNGDFLIQFKEENPTHLYITYGDINPGFNVHEVNIGNECQLQTNGKYYCDTHIDLSAYDGHAIVYWANLTDIANNRVDSRKSNAIIVDTTLPVINNLNYTIDRKYVNFKVNITEQNFDVATYSYTDTNGRLKDGTLCSRLKAGICEKKLIFKTGHYDVSVQVLDEAGNSVGQAVSFDIV